MLNRANSLLVHVAIVILSVLFILLFIEGVCRALDLTNKFDADFKFYIHSVDRDLKEAYNIEDAGLMWTPKPGFNDGVIQINAHGFRGREILLQKASHFIRVLCLGDSSTFGMRVSTAETNPALLEEKLNHEFNYSGFRFEVINAGVTGYTSAQALNLYKYKGISFRPDIVTFQLGFNDPIQRFYLDDKTIMQSRLSIAPLSLYNCLIKSSAYRLLRKGVYTLFGKNNERSVINVPRVALNDFENNILELYRLCQKNHSLLVLIPPPFRKEHIKDYDRIKKFFKYRDVLENLARTYNVPLVTIPEMTDAAKSPTSMFFCDSSHPSPLGHQKIMEKIYDAISTQILFLVGRGASSRGAVL